MISRIEDALEKLSNCNKNQIELGPHAENMVEDRNIKKQSIYDCLVEKGVSRILNRELIDLNCFTNRMVPGLTMI